MTPDHAQFAADLDVLADTAVDQIERAIGRKLRATERSVALSLFWTRASAASGEWITLAADDQGLRVAIEPVFERGFIALGARIFRRGKPAVAMMTS